VFASIDARRAQVRGNLMYHAAVGIFLSVLLYQLPPDARPITISVVVMRHRTSSSSKLTSIIDSFQSIAVRSMWLL
jgi:hypothetical protein